MSGLERTHEAPARRTRSRVVIGRIPSRHVIGADGNRGFHPGGGAPGDPGGSIAAQPTVEPSARQRQSGPATVSLLHVVAPGHAPPTVQRFRHSPSSPAFCEVKPGAPPLRLL